jgi:hypothetical protein
VTAVTRGAAVALPPAASRMAAAPVQAAALPRGPRLARPASRRRRLRVRVPPPAGPLPPCTVRVGRWPAGPRPWPALLGPAGLWSAAAARLPSRAAGPDSDTRARCRPAGLPRLGRRARAVRLFKCKRRDSDGSGLASGSAPGEGGLDSDGHVAGHGDHGLRSRTPSRTSRGGARLCIVLGG